LRRSRIQETFRAQELELPHNPQAFSVARALLSSIPKGYKRKLQQETRTIMRPGETLSTTKSIRSQKTGGILPREGTFINSIENLGRTLILVDFGPAGIEYLFPDEIRSENENQIPSNLL